MLRCSLLPLILFAFTCGLISAADLPTSAQNVLDKANADIAKVRMGLIKDLGKAQETATKKGDLDGAMAIKAEIERQSKELEGSTDLLGAARPGSMGIKVRGDGEEERVWDNKTPLPLSTVSHDLSFFLKLPKPSKQVWVRAAKGYGSERVILTIDGKSGDRMAREYTATFTTPKEVVKVTGAHGGSNDSFSYGPLQYKVEETGEWIDIPTSALAPGK